LKELSEISSYSIPIIRKSIETLKKENYLEVVKKGRKQQYILKDKLKFTFKRLNTVKETAYFIAFL
jgi:DNA-binding transcriptional regulator PaaX